MPDKTEPPAPEGQIFIYQDGVSRLRVRLDGRTVWLTQGLIAELFQTTKQNVSLHLRNIFVEHELGADSVVKESLTTAADGKRYRTLYYNLDANKLQFAIHGRTAAEVIKGRADAVKPNMGLTTLSAPVT